MRILLWDIELSYAVYYAYPSKKPQFLKAEQIKHPQFVICAAWKWLHENKIHSVSVLGQKDHRNDKGVIKKLHEVLSEADVLCGHNSDGFDLKHFNYRAMLYGLDPIPPVQTIDTLKEARKHFNAPSNSLDNLLKALGHPGKKEKPEFADWVKACEGDPKAIKKVIKYNKHDIEGQEFLYRKIRPFMRNHPNFNVTNEADVDICPSCASPNLQRRGFNKSRFGKRQRYQCSDCGAWCLGGKNLLKVNVR